MKSSKIPLTISIRELARFWDAHDLTDFEDALEEIPDPVFERRAGKAVRIRHRATVELRSDVTRP